MREEMLSQSFLVQVRELPSRRVLKLDYFGPAGEIGDAVARLSRFAIEQGVGPCGPTVAAYPRFVGAGSGSLGGGDPALEIEAKIFVPVRGRPESEEFPLVQLDRSRAACINYLGPLDAGFRQAHEELFNWMDAQAVPRTGTRHQHAYLAGQEGGDEWSVEIRVPIVGGQAPLPAV
ncbi:MAG: GyrI-like domain-containing protein [Myxococcota bacterium]|nr:GyrI-like domain-containing protein [Myxococcota bacterium]